MTSLLVLFFTHVFNCSRTKTSHAADQSIDICGSEPLHLCFQLFGHEQRRAWIDESSGPQLDSGCARNQELSRVSPVADSAEPYHRDASHLRGFIYQAHSNGPYAGSR